eukprot:CAMPEP_0197044468 /NCGR_PEP_ID=MMETSP1384-20130603/20511_1 /TAXON_ID=29189 /ORGANISM="Ammonia sp." /LENGTH=855 /DNA_ID=CAMNT_0042475927 /DNA_START=102 /DNA_END=2669 /DNA_ORIENTATION=-
MEPFELTAGSDEVNGTYAFAKQIAGISEFWYVKKLKKRKKTIEKIYKIRGGASLPQFGDQFEQCWVLQHSFGDATPIKYYAAPMKSKHDACPPNNGWICIGGIEPTPSLKAIDMAGIKEKFDSIKQKNDALKDTIGKLKDDKKNTPQNCPALKQAIDELNAIRAEYELYEYQLRCQEGMVKKAWDEVRANLDLIASQEFMYCRSADIYGGCAGLYDFGPTGAAIKNNILQEWRQHFIVADRMLQVESTMMTPKPVLLASGHVAKFSDFIVKDAKEGTPYRADHLLEEWITELLAEKQLEMSEQEIAQHKLVQSKADTYEQKELEDIMLNQYKIKFPKTGNDITPPEEFNLMFSSQIGPTGKTPGYLRPETAQGIFTNFDKLLKQNNHRMPFAAAQIGHSFRNEIAPRGGLIRVREFQMAEIEHFCEPDVRDKEYPKFKYVRNVRMRFLPASLQDGSGRTITCTIGEACNAESKEQTDKPKPFVIRNTTLGYYLARTQLFFERIGVDVVNKLRFRQHKTDEMAHYAQDCWDAELLTSMGWIECVGHADRACYDLNQHSNAAGVKLEAELIYDEPREVMKVYKSINKKEIGQKYKKESKLLLNYLESLNDDDARSLHASLQKGGGEETIKICDTSTEFKVSGSMFSIKEKKENVHSIKYVPSVVEPSFGIGRILYALLEHTIWERIDDENRIVLSLKPRIAPYQVAILPISNQLNYIAESIEAILSGQISTFKIPPKPKSDKDEEEKEEKKEKKDDDDMHYVENVRNEGIATWIDISSTAIGRKYARCDQKGIPFAVSVDFQTEKDETVTVRERDSTFPQIRVRISEIYNLIADLSSGRKKWQSVLNEYPHHVMQEI